MKVVIITISKGLIARNLLQNDFYSLLRRNFDRVIICTTAVKSQRFCNEFADNNVTIMGLLNLSDSFFARVISNISRYIIYNGRTEMMGAHNFDRGANAKFIYWYPKYLLLKWTFQPLSKLKVLRRVLQTFDYWFLNRRTVSDYRLLIKQYQPSVIFVSNIADESEAAFLKAACKEGVPSVAMVKSWDNFSKRYFPARADRLAVWNKFMFNQAQALQDYQKDKIDVVGVPQFDYYIDTARLLSREEFCRRAGLDAQKKIIFFGSEGKLMPTDPNIVGVIRDFIVKNELLEECQVFVRPHFAYTNDREKFKDFFATKEVVVDQSHNFSSHFSDGWDYSREQMDHFFNALYHSAMVINTASTLTADAIALDRPVILIQFEGYEKKSAYESVMGWYTSDYYREVVSFKAAFEADSVYNLRSAINQCLADPNVLSSEREEFRQYFCYSVDGKSGERLFNVVFKTAEKFDNKNRKRQL